jgi:rSAM/selenodomain-associated transferase 1
MARESTLVVFCRRPAAGVGKRRIAASLGDAETLELARLLLATTLEDSAAWPGPVIVAPSAATDAAWAAELSPAGAEVIPQSGGNLGQRINAVDRAARADGHSKLLFIGSDAPVLNESDFRGARAALEHADVVLGPAADGGVTAMGSTLPWPDLQSLPWSTPQLGAALERLCRESGRTIARLEPRYDIDHVADLERLSADLAADRRPARRALLHWLHHDATSHSAIARA